MPQALDEVDQALLIQKANEIIDLDNEENDVNLPLIKTKGYSPALTKLWLIHVSQRKENTFFEVIRAIINFPDGKIPREDLILFIRRIQLIQYIHKYRTTSDLYLFHTNLKKL